MKKQRTNIVIDNYPIVNGFKINLAALWIWWAEINAWTAWCTANYRNQIFCENNKWNKNGKLVSLSFTHTHMHIAHTQYMCDDDERICTNRIQSAIMLMQKQCNFMYLKLHGNAYKYIAQKLQWFQLKCMRTHGDNANANANIKSSEYSFANNTLSTSIIIFKPKLH